MPLIFNNLKRRPWRNLILAACVAAVVGMQVAAALIDRAGRYGLELGLKRLGADLVAVPRGLDPALERAYMTGEAALFYMDQAIENKIADFEFVDQTSVQLYIKSLAGASCCSAWSVFLIGFEPQTDFTIRPWLMDHPERSLGPDDVIAGAGLALEPGAALKFYGHEFKVGGVLAPTGMGLDLSVFIPISTARLMSRESAVKAEQTLDIDDTKISAVMIKLKPEQKGGLPLYRAAYEMEMALPEVTIIQPHDLALKMQHNLAGVLGSLRSAGLAVWPVTALLIGLVFAMAAAEREREIGLLRAMGASRGYVFRMIILEALFVVAAGTSIGLTISLGLLVGFSRMIALSLEVPFHWPGYAELALVMFVSVVLALLTGALAAGYPALRSSRMEPYDAIRRGEL